VAVVMSNNITPHASSSCANEKDAQKDGGGVLAHIYHLTSSVTLMSYSFSLMSLHKCDVD